MNGNLFHQDYLRAVPPAALSAYARDLGWLKTEPFGEHSDVYNAENMPELILPRTKLLGDYASTVMQLIEIFSKTNNMDHLSVYRDLITADRDVIRVRTPADYNDGSIPFDSGIDLLNGSREMLLAAACSLSNPQPLYRSGANRDAAEYLRRVSLGQTEQGSFVITILSPAIAPVIAPPIQLTYLPEENLGVEPVERQITCRLAEALASAREATELTIAGEDQAFSDAISYGVSANLCEAIVQLIGPFSELNISFAWARTYPRDSARKAVQFVSADAPILQAAAHAFRDRKPMRGVRLVGVVWKLTREEQEIEGTITMRGEVEDSNQSVTAVLSQSDYNRAVDAHRDKATVVATGDLERVGQRWRLVNPSIESVLAREVESEHTRLA